MLIYAKSIDDFKTERKDISPPLPVYLRLVPLIFYLTIGASILLNGLFFVRYSQANLEREETLRRDRQYKADLAESAQQRKELEDEAKKASDVAAWLSGARPLQPLLVEIARSIEENSTIVEVKLERDGESPAQIRFSLRLGSETPRQLDLTLVRLGEMRFRAYSPEQTVSKGEIDYKATLLWQDGNRSQADPPVPASSP